MEFIHHSPTRDNMWRAIILFGRNTASYKFALAQALIELAHDRQQTSISLSELALPYAKHLCTHLLQADKQITQSSSQFIDACRAFNNDSITDTTLTEITVRLGFNNVLDAFHVVNQEAIPTQFFVKNKTDKSITLTDDFFALFEHQKNSVDLQLETEARWRLVETAWALNLPKQVIAIHHDAEHDVFYTDDRLKRIAITGAREALNGYQKGHCFYCFDEISIDPQSPLLADVDHFFPHTLKAIMPNKNLDGVWNLVLACKACNRGHDGKFARVPSLALLERLAKRNEFLITSHHPLRETILAQTGKTIQERQSFLQQCFNMARETLIHTWCPIQKRMDLF